MADIFISYARADRGKIEKLAAALEAEGFSVWWDRNLESGAEFSKDIERELNQAKAVIVCWSEAGVQSRWVKDEATIAAKTGKLKTISLDGATPPIGYMQYHALDLSSWISGTNDPAFQHLVSDAKKHFSKLGSADIGVDETTSSKSTSPEIQKPNLGGPKIWVGVLGAIALIVLIGVISLRSVVESGADFTANEDGIGHSNSIAVLPFVALSDDASDEYFGKGIAEELLNALAQFPELKVAARTSAFSFEGQNVDLREVGQSLEVAHVLEGSVRRAGDRLRITAQLIRVSDGFHIWSETYERELTDVFAIQDEIVEELSRNLQLRLGVGGGAGRASAKSVDPRAYQQYLRGLFLWGSRHRLRSNRPDALKALQRAVEFDPDFAEAWGAIGIVGAFSDPNSLNETADEFVSRTETAFARALALDPDNVTAHIGLAPWHANYKVDIEKARHHLDRALALAPNRAEAQYAAALYWGAAGDDAAMFRAFDRAIALDPLNNSIQRIHAQMQLFTGRDDAAFAYLEDCQEKQCMDPGLLTGGILFAAMLTGDEQRTDWALNEIDAAMGTGHNLGEIADVLLERGDSSKPILKLDFGEPGHPNFFGLVGPVIAKTAGEEALFNALEQLQADGLMFSEPYGWAPYFGANPYPDWVLRHPRYHALWERPGMAGLAAARRANGQSAGLPLPMEQAAD